VGPAGAGHAVAVRRGHEVSHAIARCHAHADEVARRAIPGQHRLAVSVAHADALAVTQAQVNGGDQ
jgi:hypothetical protein